MSKTRGIDGIHFLRYLQRPGASRSIDAPIDGYIYRVPRLLHSAFQESKSMSTSQSSHARPPRRFTLATFEQSLVGIAITGAQDDAVLEVNDAMCSMLGYSRDELKARGFMGVTHPEDAGDTRAAIGRVVSSNLQRIRFEKRLVCGDGRTVRVMVHLGVVAIEGRRERILRQVWDITGRCETERRLRESGQRYRAASLRAASTCSA